jgi:hypothetical protein
MSLEGQMVKRSKAAIGVVELVGQAAATDAEARVYHERELRFIAAFRLRDAANRVATLVSLTTSASLRSELLAVYERLMEEERELLVRSMDAVTPRLARSGAGRPNSRRPLT